MNIFFALKGSKLFIIISSKMMFNLNLRKLPSQYGEVSVMLSKFGNVKLHGLYLTFGPLRSVWPSLFLLNVFTALKGTHFFQ